MCIGCWAKRTIRFLRAFSISWIFSFKILPLQPYALHIHFISVFIRIGQKYFPLCSISYLWNALKPCNCVRDSCWRSAHCTLRSSPIHASNFECSFGGAFSLTPQLLWLAQIRGWRINVKVEWSIAIGVMIDCFCCVKFLQNPFA